MRYSIMDIYNKKVINTPTKTPRYVFEKESTPHTNPINNTMLLVPTAPRSCSYPSPFSAPWPPVQTSIMHNFVVWKHCYHTPSQALMADTAYSLVRHYHSSVSATSLARYAIS